jgi:hypothetical protein
MKKKNEEIPEYLTEKSLGEKLTKIFSNQVFIHDEVVPDSGVRFRPDYRCDELHLIIEFDGDRHYREAAVIVRDQKKDKIFSKMGYKVVRIPYFVQLTKDIIKFIFDVDYDFHEEYPHGFISKEAKLPADFCELGVKKFKEDLIRFQIIKGDIIESLKEKQKGLGVIELVVPPSLFSLLTSR